MLVGLDLEEGDDGDGAGHGSEGMADQARPHEARSPSLLQLYAAMLVGAALAGGGAVAARRKLAALDR